MDAANILADEEIQNAMSTAKARITAAIERTRIKPLEATVKHLRRKLEENGIPNWITPEEAITGNLYVGMIDTVSGQSPALCRYIRPEGQLPGWFNETTGHRIPSPDIRWVKKVFEA